MIKTLRLLEFLFSLTLAKAFNLSAANQVTVSVFNALGQLVETINTTDLEAGKHVLSFNTADYSSGIYTVKVQGNGFSAAEKFIVE